VHYDPETVFESQQYINANSFSKRVRTERWSKEETAKFYRVIQQYGSDFTLVSKLFPNR
jgi:transcription factor TFIIIB component B''